jgi:hypothetical protein
MEAHEFVCADCKADVFSFGGRPDETRCASCNLVREMPGLTPEREKLLREILGCMIPEAQ